MNSINIVHRINLQIVAAVYPRLHEAIKDLKPRDKAEMIRKLAEQALVLLDAQKKCANKGQNSSDESTIKSTGDDIDDALSLLFENSPKEEDK